MFEDSFMDLVVAERLKEAERIGERARALEPVRRGRRLRSRLARLLAAVGSVLTIWR